MPVERDFSLGTIIATRNSCDSDCTLGLVVDHEKAMKWVNRDPCHEYRPKDMTDFVLVRILGIKLSEGGRPLGKWSLPEREPHGTEIVRWAFAQRNQSWHVAGPNYEEIEAFLGKCRLCEALGMKGATFFYDLALVAQYLKGVKRRDAEISHNEKSYFRMLKEVLPRP